MNDRTDGIVIGIDGGGTHTRVMAADLAGHVLAYVEHGASSIHKDLHARQNVQQAIRAALEQAGKRTSQVLALTAGIAGFDSEADLEWVQPMTDIDGLNCPKQHVNDAVVAHSGALLTKPGIIVISGTGSIIYAVNEEGRSVRNYDLHHYAASAARFLAYDATYELLAGHVDDSDRELIREMLQFWGLSTTQELSQLALQGFIKDQRERNKKFALLAPAITQAAVRNSRLAVTVCDRAVHQITVGVKMLGSFFTEAEVNVSLIGSVVNSEYFRQQLTTKLVDGGDKTYNLLQPAFSPTAGAVLLAYKQLNLPIGEDVLRQLSQHPGSMQDSKPMTTPYPFEWNYDADVKKRERLFPLFRKVFGFEESLLRTFYASGLANPTYTPFTFFDDGAAIANVSMFELPLLIKGQRVSAAGIQSVMTDPAYRRRGLFRELFKKLLNEIDRRYSVSFLFTNSPELYRPFGFREVEQHSYVSPNRSVSKPGTKLSFRKLDVFAEADVAILHRLFKQAAPLSQVFSPLAYEASFYLNLFDPYFQERTFYSEELDLIVVYEVTEGTLKLYDVIGKEIPRLETIMGWLGASVKAVECHFHPDRLGGGPYECVRVPSKLMVRGDAGLPDDFAFPITASF